MITTPQEYLANLDILQSVKQPTHALLPAAETIYNIDVNSRIIEAPEFVSVERDHKSETLYFAVDRFVDYMDLASTCCIIQYKNAKKKTRYYAVPFYDIYKLADKKKIVFPWCLDGNTTEATGSISFAIQFFKIGERLKDDNTPEVYLTYSLNTQVANSKILKGMEEQQLSAVDEYYLKATQYQELASRIQNLEQFNKVYWTIVTDPLIEPANTDEIQEELEEVLNNAESLPNDEEEAVG